MKFHCVAFPPTPVQSTSLTKFMFTATCNSFGASQKEKFHPVTGPCVSAGADLDCHLGHGWTWWYFRTSATYFEQGFIHCVTVEPTVSRVAVLASAIPVLSCFQLFFARNIA